MERSNRFRGKSITSDILRWKATKGGTNRDGSQIGKPMDLVLAEIIDGICQRYSQLPSAVLNEDVMVLKVIQIMALMEEKSNAQ